MDKIKIKLTPEQMKLAKRGKKKAEREEKKLYGLMEKAVKDKIKDLD